MAPAVKLVIYFLLFLFFLYYLNEVRPTLSLIVLLAKKLLLLFTRIRVIAEG